MANSTITWTGESGAKYKYYLYEFGHKLKAEGGNYIFCQLLDNGNYRAIYVGQTDSLDLRFDNHHKAQCILDAGMTHLCAHLEPNLQKRLAEETDLIRRLKTACNG